METECRPPSPCSPDLASQECIAHSPPDPPFDADIASLDIENQVLAEVTVSSTVDPPPDADIASRPSHEQTGAVVLSDDLRDHIVRQGEYYFSDANLPTDKFLLKFVKRDTEGFVPIAVIASFKRIKKLVQDHSLIEAALRTSSQLVVSLDGRKVRRLHPLPITELKDAKPRTVVVENLPDDYSKEGIQRMFGNIGNITNVIIRDPHLAEESSKPMKAISNKLHALVEYETVEAAESAVATLNDERNWRSGMRVELLVKRMGKYGMIHRGHKETTSEKNNCNQTSEIGTDGQKLISLEHPDEMAEKEDVQQSSLGKGARRSRYKGRGRGHTQQNTNGQGHGCVPLGSSTEGVSKPLPGPRMPDGTRGFTMGRGKPAALDCIQHDV